MESIKFTGLASGMDTQSIVDSMMQARRLPLDRLKADKQTFEWQRSEYREMSKLLKEFDQFIFDGISRQANMLKRTVTSSNEDLVSATVAAGKGDVSFTLENVSQLAKPARLMSSSSIGSIDPSKSLWSQFQSPTDPLLGFWKQESGIEEGFTVPDDSTMKKFQLSKGAVSGIGADDTISVTTPNDPTVPSSPTTSKNYTIVTDKTTWDGYDAATKADRVFLNTETGLLEFGEELAAGSEFSVTYDHNYLSFNIETNKADGTRQSVDGGFKFSGSTSLNKMFEEINSSNAGVNMFYDEGTQRVVATRTETGDLGTETEIQFTESITTGLDPGDPEDANSSFFTNILNMDPSVPYDSITGNGSYSDGLDASFTVNGLTTTRKSNNFTINDVTIDLKSKFTDPVNISSKTDTEGIFDTIKSFVDKYNEMIGKVNGKLTEENYRSFKPLTDEQKANMSEKEIEDWEEKAKSGLLRRDSVLSSGMNKLRQDIYTEVSASTTNSDYNQLAEIGITTSKNYLEHGKLELDEAKLKKAIEKDPEAIYELFMAEGDTYSEKGIARRLRDSLDETMDKVREKAGSQGSLTNHGHTIGKQILRLDDNIDSYERRLKMIEERLWDQFNAMEKAMQRMNQQSAQLMSQLGMGGGQ
ncbi:flagellar hook-associated protein 2 [Bacillus tianshenii]|nr:flagellar hook-associated protein 2 [Bacillus tianshenii]